MNIHDTIVGSAIGAAGILGLFIFMSALIIADAIRSPQMIPTLILAARAARQASNADRDIEIVLTENGPIIRGIATINGQRCVATRDLDWSEYDLDPPCLTNAVGLVVIALDQTGRMG